MDCICRYLEERGEINGFKYPNEYKKLLDKLEELVIANELNTPEIVRKYFWNRRYRCTHCGTVWVLTEHDFPFRGYFGKAEWLNDSNGN